MLAVRRLLALALFGVLTAAFAGPANAARPAVGPETMTTTHFQVHYVGSPDITHQFASDFLTSAEQAYTTIVGGWGYPAPLNDGDGLIDVWIEDMSAAPGLLGFAEQDTPGNNPSSGWIAVADIAAVDAPETIAHELTHLIQFGLWVPADTWMLESTAEWAGLATTGYTQFGTTGFLEQTLGAPDMSLDCTSAACGTSYETAGYTRWEFFQYLTERYGVGIVRDVFARGAALADPALTGSNLLDSTLATKGTTLSSVYNDFSFAQVAGNSQVAELKGLPPIAHKTISTGSNSLALPVLAVPVNHLATRYLRLARGDGESGTCYAATLSLTVGLPAGVGSRPSFYWKALGSAPLPLTINGGTASITVPWDTCAGGQDGYLALPNSSLTLDAQVFTVSGALNVDKKTIVSTLGPPLPIYTGPMAAAVGAIAPAIRVYGAQLVRVPSGTRKVRLIVFSGGPGKLRAAVGSTVLGTYALRPGNNDIRFTLPVRTLQALRSTAKASASSKLLTLTSLSTAGTTGKSVTRRLVVSKPTRR
jgi:hypothetical protein